MLKQLIADMKTCQQSPTQNVLEHGISVKNHFFELVDSLKNNSDLQNWKLPDWLPKYSDQLVAKLLPTDVIEEYLVYHDCSKPYCQTIDDEGKTHFTGHAELSYAIWLSYGGNHQAAKLMKMDMIVHQMKTSEIDEFIKNPEAATLLLAALSEIHANAALFGGFDSVSFKIKFKHLNRIGNKICEKLFKVQHVES